MSQDDALVELLHWLKRRNYRFTAVTPLTHARILARPWSAPAALRDIFGWSRPFVPDDVDPDLVHILERGGALEEGADGLRSRFRVASLGGDLFLHSAFPTGDADAVFFGPDTYRFARFIAGHLPRIPRPTRIVDMGAGSGAGGIACARLMPDAAITLVDVNPAALRLARINTEAASVDAAIEPADRIPSGAGLIVANPPYMIDSAHRAYRDGGGLLGGEVALDWARQAFDVLEPGGALLLYTGAAIVDGRSPLVDAIEAACRAAAATFAVEELDPDVFGEELETPAYNNVERIAAVGIRISRA